MKTRLPRHRQAAGFAPQGCFELMFLVHIVGGIVSLAFGNWISAALLLGPVSVLFVVFKYQERNDRCRVGDRIRVMHRPHPYFGMEGVIIGEHENEDGKSFMVKLLSAEHAVPVNLPANYIVKIKTAASISSSDETAQV